MKGGLKEIFRKEKGLGSRLGSPQRKVKVLSLQETHHAQALSLLAHLKLFDFHNHLDLVRLHQVLLLEVEPHQRGVHDVVSSILDLVALRKCVFSVGRQGMLRGFALCLMRLLQWDKLWVSPEL